MSYKASDLAKLFGISERQVVQLASEGVIPKADRGTYDIIACTQQYIAHLRDGRNVVNAEALAEHLGLATNSVHALVREGMPRIKRGRYDLGECTRWYIEKFRHRLEQGGETDDVGEERRRLLAQQRRKATIEADLLEGEQIPREEVMEDLQSIAGVIATTSEGMAGRLCHEVAGITDAGVARQRILDECRAMRDAIASAIRKYTEGIA